MAGNKILAIDPGAKELGVAILNEQDLLYYGVKTLKHAKAPGYGIDREVARLLGYLIERYQPKYLAIEQPVAVQQKAAMLLLVIDEIKAFAHRQGVSLREYAPKDIRRFICREEKPTKRETAKRLALYYPELGQYLSQKSKWGQVYYAHVLDAVAVGLMCQYDIHNAS